jgi:hypothetical protein
MSDNVIQTSFSAGELAPNLNARVDFAKYRSGCATMRNFFVDYRSGASTRPGTEFIRPADITTGSIASRKIRLVRFQQSVSVTYILEFGDFYIRFISQGASIVEDGLEIANITNEFPAHADVPGHGFQQGDLIFISGVAGMPQVNNRYFLASNPVADSFTLADALTGALIDSTNWGVVEAPPGLAQRVYTIGTPYSINELPYLKFSQNASVMNITSPFHPPHKLQLFSATAWDLSQVVFGSTVIAPLFNGFSSSTTGSVSYKYTATSVDANGQESPPIQFFVADNVADLRTTPGSHTISWVANGAASYNIYGSSPSYTGQIADAGGFGFMGSIDASATLAFIDSNIAPDFSQTPPVHEDPFGPTGTFPAVSSYFQQRLVYANGGGNLVATFWASRTGAPYNFDVSNPVQANDAITAELVSLEVNEIMSLVPMPTGLIALTTCGAWQINGGAGGVATQGGPITPITATATPQAYIGANGVPPIVINFDILFIQAKGSIVRDLTFNLYQNIYTGNDISILSSHMFYGHQILEWAYAEEPFKTVWCVREDGVLLCLTLVKEQDMYGWSRHDTRGNFESVATVTEGQFDATYVAVRRPNPRGDGTVLQIERFANRTFQFGAEDAWCVDAGVKTTSNFPGANLEVTVPDADGNVILLASDPVFTSDMIGWIARVGGGILKVIEFLDELSLKASVIQPITDLIPNDPKNSPDLAPFGTWSLDKPFTKLFGLDHLEGQEVSVLADGGVVNGLVVQDGSITLPAPVTKVVAGYAFQAQLQTMPLDLGNEINSVQGKRKKVGALTVRVKDSRGIKAGMTFDTVTPIKEMNRVTLMGLPIKLFTSDERVVMDPLWDVPGQICLQIDDPLPATVLGVIPEVVIGDGQK